jgi:hypothetical protein
MRFAPVIGVVVLSSTAVFAASRDAIPGQLTRAQLLAGVADFHIRAAACEETDELSNVYFVRVRIEPDGSVREVSTTGRHANSNTGACVADAARRTTFPTFTGAPMTFEWCVLVDWLDEAGHDTPLMLKWSLRKAMHACYEEHHDYGLYVVRITLSPTGTVSRAHVRRSAYTTKRTAACVARASRTGTFPRFRGRPFTANVPFILRPPVVHPPDVTEARDDSATAGRGQQARSCADRRGYEVVVPGLRSFCL